MISLISSVVAIGCIGNFCYYQNNKLQVTELNVNLKQKLKNEIRVVQISDLHSKIFGQNNKILFNKIIELNPDIIFATGDLIDSNLKNMDETISFLGRLNKIARVVYIPGNNETRCGKLDEIIGKLKDLQVIALKNEIIELKIKNETLVIVGLAEAIDKSDLSRIEKVNENYYYEYAYELIRKIEKRNEIKIILSHYPEKFYGNNEEGYYNYNIDIMFSGHAHGGQFILPFVGGLFAPGQGILPKYYRGIHGDKSKLIISRGLGNSGFPLRLFNRPEVILAKIK